MSLGRNLGINKPYDETIKGFVAGLKPYYQRPTDYYVEPFEIVKHLYYIGDRNVCSHLIDTGDGLLLFDSGYSHAIHMLLHSINTLGFNPADIRWIIHSHGHFDHFGGSDALRAFYGCRTFISHADAEMLRENPAASLCEYAPVRESIIPTMDYEIEDGEILQLGRVQIRCVLAPGHSQGTMAFFFDLSDGDHTYRVGYWGGIGFLTLYREFLLQYGQPLYMPQLLTESIKKLRPEQVDIVLGNHPNHNGTLEKRAAMLEHPESNPFIDASEWAELMDAVEKRLFDFMEKAF